MMRKNRIIFSACIYIFVITLALISADGLLKEPGYEYIIGYVIFAIIIANVYAMNKYLDNMVVDIISENEDVIFVTAKKKIRFLKTDCINIMQTPKGYIFHFKSGEKLRALNVKIGRGEGINPELLNTVNFPFAKRTTG